MFRGMRALGAVGVMTVAMGVAPVGAARVVVPPAVGTITCGLTGSATFTPGYPSASKVDGSTVPIKFKLVATIGPCPSVAVTGGKATITSGAVTFTATLPVGSGCGDLLFGTPDFFSNPNKLTVKWTNVNGTRHTLIGSNHTDISGGLQINQGWELDADSFLMQHSPFANEFPTLDLIFTNLPAIGACAFGGPAINTVAFRATGGSFIDVSP